MRRIYLIGSANTFNGALETWFYQNEMLGGIPFTLDMEAGKIFDSVVIFIELASETISLNFIRALRANRNKVVFLDMGDEMGKKDVTPYAECDLVIRNYLYLNIFQDERYRDKVIWLPNGFRTGVGPRNPAHLKPVTERQWLATFLGWLNPRSFNNERLIFKEVAPRCGGNLFMNVSPNWAGGYNLGLYSGDHGKLHLRALPGGQLPGFDPHLRRHGTRLHPHLPAPYLPGQPIQHAITPFPDPEFLGRIAGIPRTQAAGNRQGFPGF